MPDGPRLSRLAKSMPTSQMIRTLQIIQGAMAFGVVLFGAIALGCAYGVQAPPDSLPSSDVYFLNLVSMFNIAMACVAILLGWLLDRTLTGRFKPSTSLDPRREIPADSPVFGEFVAAVFPARVIRLAMLEASAWAGEAVCLVGGLKGIIQRQPVYLLNMIPAGLMVAYAIVTFPTMGRMRDELASHLARTQPGAGRGS